MMMMMMMMMMMILAPRGLFLSECYYDLKGMRHWGGLGADCYSLQ